MIAVKNQFADRAVCPPIPIFYDRHPMMHPSDESRSNRLLIEPRCVVPPRKDLKSRSEVSIRGLIDCLYLAIPVDMLPAIFVLGCGGLHLCYYRLLMVYILIIRNSIITKMVIWIKIDLFRRKNICRDVGIFRAVAVSLPHFDLNKKAVVY